MGSKSSCFFIVFVLVFVSSLSSSLAAAIARIHSIPDIEEFNFVILRLRDKDWMGVFLFNNSDYQHQGYQDICQKHTIELQQQVHCFRINTETFSDKDIVKVFNITYFPTFRFHIQNRQTFGPIRVMGWVPQAIEYMINIYLHRHDVTVAAAAE
ncbi:hypothetical protein C5167_030134 [Papaver somniferum]|uniref:uncharacterized protein LOC113329465 n=1 Tax=Papaver somniferum TaxID=3469 RepID=UPI000E6F8389|nr:uncharacterized protein LOC113329465 [Papaver somniferum]RZC86781.1 hypothetical protein C5167_030134 [Papaver somniferum]